MSHLRYQHYSSTKTRLTSWRRNDKKKKIDLNELDSARGQEQLVRQQEQEYRRAAAEKAEKKHQERKAAKEKAEKDRLRA
eukprot:3743316-Amphidinium_carterae.1